MTEGRSSDPPPVLVSERRALPTEAQTDHQHRRERFPHGHLPRGDRRAERTARRPGGAKLDERDVRTSGYNVFRVRGAQLERCAIDDGEMGPINRSINDYQRVPLPSVRSSPRHRIDVANGTTDRCASAPTP
jgi:hypothetical protein